MAASNLKIPAAFVPLLATNFNPSAAFVNGFASNFSAFARNLGVLAANFPPPAATYNLLPQSSLYEIATTKRKMHKKIGFPLLCRLRFFAASFPPSTINH